jgi:glycosyltransferase involved in cell wall biosynthesis
MKVSFIVPCYRLAHLLPECVDSILRQSFEDFEILIMDDCSPDDTPRVAAAFTDPRITYIRHPENLGHLRNYNEGIRRARGEYIWLISADDVLRTPTALQQFVSALDRTPGADFAFSQATRWDGAGELGVFPRHLTHTEVMSPERALSCLLAWNCVPAAGALAKRSCYERANYFPLDLPYAGDWYLWCHFALHAPVVYIAEPLVKYRYHEQNMTKYFKDRLPLLRRDEIEVYWRVLRLAEAQGSGSIARCAHQALAEYYARQLQHAQPMLVEEVAESVRRNAGVRRNADAMLAGVFAAAGDLAYAAEDQTGARRMYRRSLSHGGRLNPAAKLALLQCGRLGRWIRDRIPGGLPLETPNT